MLVALLISSGDSYMFYAKFLLPLAMRLPLLTHTLGNAPVYRPAAGLFARRRRGG